MKKIIQTSLFPETMQYLEAQTEKQKWDKKCFEEHQTKMNLLFEITGMTFRERRIENKDDELILKLHYLKNKYKKGGKL